MSRSSSLSPPAPDAHRPSARWVLAWSVGVGLAAVLAGCAPHPWGPTHSPSVAPAPQTRWAAPVRLRAPESKTAPTASAAPAPSPERPLTLAELIDAGLAGHPDTRAAWLAARAAAAALAAERGALHPHLALTADGVRTRGAAAGGLFTYEATFFEPGIELSYVLLDFGARRAAIEQARQALLAANWTHNAALADRVLAITEAFHSHQAALALADAEGAAVDEARANLRAAQERRRAGVATLADVLQSQTVLSRAELTLATYAGRVAITRGELNAAVGWPAQAPLAVEPLPAELPFDRIGANVERLVELAEERRPELAAVLAEARGAQARVEQARAAGRPTLSLHGVAGRAYFTDPTAHTDVYTATVGLRWPVFTGFAQTMNVRRAEAEVEAALARLEALRRRIDLALFRNHHDARTALERMRASRDLTASATQSHSVAQARYQAGAGGLLELLAAQRALEDARAQDVEARSDWLIALARLARECGGAPPAPGRPEDHP